MPFGTRITVAPIQHATNELGSDLPEPLPYIRPKSADGSEAHAVIEMDGADIVCRYREAYGIAAALTKCPYRAPQKLGANAAPAPLRFDADLCYVTHFGRYQAGQRDAAQIPSLRIHSHHGCGTMEDSAPGILDDVV